MGMAGAAKGEMTQVCSTLGAGVMVTTIPGTEDLMGGVQTLAQS